MIVFIDLVKRGSILHEKFFIYKKQFTIQYNTIHTHQLNNTKQCFRILSTKQTTSEY